MSGFNGVYEIGPGQGSLIWILKCFDLRVVIGRGL
jgi:hypothetical protein